MLSAYIKTHINDRSLSFLLLYTQNKIRFFLLWKSTRKNSANSTTWINSFHCIEETLAHSFIRWITANRVCVYTTCACIVYETANIRACMRSRRGGVLVNARLCRRRRTLHINHIWGKRTHTNSSSHWQKGPT